METFCYKRYLNIGGDHCTLTTRMKVMAMTEMVPYTRMEEIHTSQYLVIHLSFSGMQRLLKSISLNKFIIFFFHFSVKWEVELSTDY